MKFGFWVPNVGHFGDPELLLELGVAAERGGWDGFFVWDMVTPAAVVDAPLHAADPVVALSAVAAATDRIAVGPMITPVARRRPHKLARETVTLDRLSNGRLILGVGLGDPAQEEFEKFGEDSDARVRADKLDEGLEVLAQFWSGEPVTFDGDHVTVRDATFLPTPVQKPRIPIWAAAHWPLKRPMRRGARWDGVFPISTGSPFTPADYREMLAFVSNYRIDDGTFDLVHAEHNGLSPPDPERVNGHEEAGVTWWLVFIQPDADVEAVRELASTQPRPASSGIGKHPGSEKGHGS
jgi:alkanesulfonate monooxygenase SsuD/methylene tetrahydromethanopterin reductase-like flavin-dependent oxidoreductase (luciferase family)